MCPSRMSAVVSLRAQGREGKFVQTLGLGLRWAIGAL